MADQRSLFDQAWDVLRFHNKNVRSTEQTLNRLFREQLEHLDPQLLDQAPHIWEHNLLPRIVHWGSEELGSLPRLHKNMRPKGPSDLPILVVEFHARRCLVDGTNRVNLALAHGADARLEVIFLSVREASGPG